MSYATQAKRFGLKKETTRLTAESTPDYWFAADPESNMDYALKHIQDPSIRGVHAAMPPVAGPKTCEGKIMLPANAQDVGELFHMLLGDAVSAQQAATSAYLHTFTPNASISPDTYTIFEDRGLNVMKYNGCAVKKIDLSCAVDGLVKLGAEIIGIAEASGSIGTPSYAGSALLAFPNVTAKLGGSSDTNIRSWACSIENGLQAKRTLAQSQNAQDVVRMGQYKASGSFVIFFENATQRDNFIANTAQAVQFLIEGAIIASTYKYTIDVSFPKAHFTAFPYEDEGGLLAAKVTFEAFYDTATSKLCSVAVTNTKTAYA